jgi:hypothetical protein
MFGNDLLVAPVITEDDARTIAFPAGQWTSLWDGSVLTGPASVRLKVPLDITPVFLKEGAAMPVRLGKNLKFGESMTAGAVRALIVALPRESEGLTFDTGSGVTFRRADKGFVLRCESVPEAQYLLLYGASVLRIQLDGTILHGWHNDTGSGRVVVPLPKAVKENGALREINVELVTRHGRR